MTAFINTILKCYLLVCIVALASCGSDENKLFRIRKGPELGIRFVNTITTNDSLDALSFEYIYNGSGVGVGDFNNDGLEDLVFGGNQVSSRLYINKGNFQFEDMTDSAGIATSRWITGVSIVDINQDGLQDIYFCVAGKTDADNRRNVLYVNKGVTNGIPHFEERSKSYGLDDDSYSTMAAFFDYDKDGDLDMYLVNNWLERYNRNNIRQIRTNGEAESTDNLYRNNGDNTFSDVSKEAGILIEGYGLGVVINDVNQDSWPDVYVSNDFLSSDLLWINQRDGTFKNEIRSYIRHTTHNGMGIDIADFNNDQLDDIVVVDMFPPGHKRQKLMTAGQNYDHFHMALQYGYMPQYMRNTLQLNRGKTSDGKIHFSEIGFSAGIAQTDWSWAPLFMDADNDGDKDLFIGNGYRKDVTDLDFIFFGGNGSSPFGTTESRKAKFNKELDDLPSVKISNYIFGNNGSLTFEDKTKDWGLDLETFSNGAAYSDLDNDGDLDLITNNIDQEVIIYENRSRTTTQNNFITISCADPTSTFNEKIKVFTSDKKQSIERTPYRGFQSTVTNSVHFGVADALTIDSVEVWWPDSTVSTYKNVQANTRLDFSKKDAVQKQLLGGKKAPLQVESRPAFYHHKESSLSDIKITRTLLHELSRYGPCIATADVNNDKLDDLFVGGEPGQKSRLYIQQSDASFKEEHFPSDSSREDGMVHFFDWDNDGDQDLYVGGACSSSTTKPSGHLMYENDGKGQFALLHSILPDINVSTSCVVSADYDGDGDQDLFVGGRFEAGKYPLPTRSYVLRNDQNAFVDITKQLNPDLESPGSVADAVWADINKDGKPDLVVTGEWMPIRVFKNAMANFQEITSDLGLQQSNGWWNCVEAADLNNDGYAEIIAGNVGSNSYFKPSKNNPVTIVAKDFDKSGSIDPIISYYNQTDRERFIVHNRLVVIDQIPGIKKRFETFTQYATTPFEKAFSQNDLADAIKHEIYVVTSSVFVNHNGERMQTRDLPDIAQLSHINDILVEDLNSDGKDDLILIGNNYSQETMFGAYDASVGTVLLGDGKLNWKSLAPPETNFIADKDAKMIKSGRLKRGQFIIIGNNNDDLQVFFIKK